jgi:hypothetical protein
VKPDAGHAAHSAVGALPPQLTAGVAQAVTVTARDAAGNATAGGDRMELMLDSVAEGGSRLGFRMHFWSCHSISWLSSCS